MLVDFANNGCDCDNLDIMRDGKTYICNYCLNRYVREPLKDGRSVYRYVEW